MDGKDLVVRILGDNSSFVKSLVDSKNSLDSMSAMAKKAAGVLGALGGATGLAMGSMEAFNTAMHSNLETENKWVTQTDGAKKTVTEFFAALTTGNWSSFNDGIAKAINLNKQLVKVLKDVQRNLWIGDIRLSDYEADMDKYESTIDNPRASREDTEEAWVGIKNTFNKLKNDADRQKKHNTDRINNILKAKSITGDVRQLLLDYLDTSTEAYYRYDEYKKQKSLVNTLRGKVELNGKRGISKAEQNKVIESYNKQLSILNQMLSKDPNLKSVENIYQKLDPEDISAILEATGQTANLSSRVAMAQNTVTSLEADFDKNGKYIGDKYKKLEVKPTVTVTPKVKVEVKEEKKTQLLKDLENTIKFSEVEFGEDWKFSEDGVLIYKSYFSELKKIYAGDKDELNNVLLEEKKYIKSYNNYVKENTVDLTTIGGIDKEIAKVKNKMQTDSYLLYKQDKEYLEILLELRDRFEKGNLVGGSIESTISRIKALNSTTTTFFNSGELVINKERWNEAQTYLQYAEDNINRIRLKLKDGFDSFSLGTTLDDTFGIIGNKIPLKNNTIDRLVRERLKGLMDTHRSYLSNILGLELPTSDENLEIQIGWANDYATALNSCATAVQALNTTKLDNNAQGWKQFTANTLSQIGSLIAAYYALAQASGVANAMKFPFPANLAIWATVAATIVSVFGSLPSFSEGGIFEGRSDVGDMNFARVNSGEMILNNRQQRNLFNLLNSGGAGISSNNQVEFKIQGRELVGVLSNYNNKMRKV